MLRIKSKDPPERVLLCVVKDGGRLAGVVNNAGYSLVGAVEETSIEEMRHAADHLRRWRICRLA